MFPAQTEYQAFALVFERKKTEFIIPKHWLAQKLRKTISEKVNTE